MRFRLGTYLAVYAGWWKGDSQRAREVVETLGPLARSPELDPLAAVMWRTGEAPYHWNRGASGTCARLVREALAISDETGMHIWDFMIHLQCAAGAIAADDATTSHGSLRRCKQTLRPGARLALGTHELFSALLALREGRLVDADESAKESPSPPSSGRRDGRTRVLVWAKRLCLDCGGSAPRSVCDRYVPGG